MQLRHGRKVLHNVSFCGPDICLPVHTSSTIIGKHVPRQRLIDLVCFSGKKLSIRFVGHIVITILCFFC